MTKKGRYTDMNQKTLLKLEYDKITALLEEQASSFRGRQLCRRPKPMTDIEKINTWQEQTAAAFTRIVKKGRTSFGDASPVEESMKRLEIGGALGSGELLRICRLLLILHESNLTAGTIRRRNWQTVWTTILKHWNRSHRCQAKSSAALSRKKRSATTPAARSRVSVEIWKSSTGKYTPL